MLKGPKMSEVRHFHADAGLSDHPDDSPLISLRDELIRQILSFLFPHDLCRVRNACKKLRNLGEADALWGNLIGQSFNPPGTTWKTQPKKRTTMPAPSDDGRLLRKFRSLATAGVVPGGRYASAATTLFAASSRCIEQSRRVADAKGMPGGAAIGAPEPPYAVRCFVACFHSDSSALFHGAATPISAVLSRKTLETHPIPSYCASGPRAELVYARSAGNTDATREVLTSPGEDATRFTGQEEATAGAAGASAVADSATAYRSADGRPEDVDAHAHAHAHHHHGGEGGASAGCESCRLREIVFARPGVLELHKQIAASAASGGSSPRAADSSATAAALPSGVSPAAAIGAAATSPRRSRFLQLKLVIQHGGFVGLPGREAPFAVLASDAALLLRDGSYVPAHAVLSHVADEHSPSTSPGSAAQAAAAAGGGEDAGGSGAAVGGSRSDVMAPPGVTAVIAALNGDEIPAVVGDGMVVGAVLWPAGFVVLRLAFPFDSDTVRFEPEALERCAGLCIPLRSVIRAPCTGDDTAICRSTVGPVVAALHFNFTDAGEGRALSISCEACELRSGAVASRSFVFTKTRFGNAEPAVSAPDWESRIWQIYRPIPGGAFGKIEGDVAGGAGASGMGGVFSNFTL